MCRGDVPKRDPCPKNPGKRMPSKEKRVRLWRGFNKLHKGALKTARQERYKGNMCIKESAYARALWVAQRRNLSKKADGTSMTLRGKRGERVKGLAKLVIRVCQVLPRRVILCAFGPVTSLAGVRALKTCRLKLESKTFTSFVSRKRICALNTLRCRLVSPGNMDGKWLLLPLSEEIGVA